MQSAISDISEEVENLRKKAESTELASQDWIDSVITVIDNSIILDRLEKKANSVSDSLRGKCKFVCRSHLCNKMSQWKAMLGRVMSTLQSLRWVHAMLIGKKSSLFSGISKIKGQLAAKQLTSNNFQNLLTT